MATVRQMKSVPTSKLPVTRYDVKQMLRSLESTKELKKSTDTYSGTCAAAGAVISLSDVIGQGDNLNSRVGDVIQMKLVQTNFRASSGSATANYVRFIVFHDRFNLGTAPTVTAVLNTATITSFYAFANDQVGRFTILSDDVYKMIPTNFPLAFEKHSHKMNRPVHFNGTGASSPGANSLFAIVLTDASANFPTYAFDVNMRYTD